MEEADLSANDSRRRKGPMASNTGYQRTVAQQRRFLENIEFEKLSAELPIARAISGQHIDKVSSHLTISVQNVVRFVFFFSPLLRYISA